MTDQRLRDLLHEHVADVQPADLGAAAWRDARRTRQRRTTAAAVAAVAVVAVVAGALVVGRDGGPVEPVNTPQVLPGTVAAAEQGGDYRGAPTWSAPAASDEAHLLLLAGTPLPGEIDLSPGAPAHPAGEQAVAVFEVAGESSAPGRVVVVGADRTSYSLDVGRLERVTDEEGNALSPLTAESLAPDGRHVFFIQKSSLEVYDLMTGAWASHETVPWLAETARWLSDDEIWAPGELGRPDGTGTTYDVTGSGSGTSSLDLPRVWDTSDEPYGPVRESAGGSVAQATFRADDARDALAARVGGEVSLLVMPGVDDGRWKGCCPVAGWLDDRTVVFESLSSTSRILAWRVGTADLRRVSRITGWEPGQEVPVGSFADFR